MQLQALCNKQHAKCNLSLGHQCGMQPIALHVVGPYHNYLNKFQFVYGKVEFAGILTVSFPCYEAWIMGAR